jgi:hypothetical protein
MGCRGHKETLSLNCRRSLRYTCYNRFAALGPLTWRIELCVVKKVRSFCAVVIEALQSFRSFIFLVAGKIETEQGVFVGSRYLERYYRSATLIK